MPTPLIQLQRIAVVTLVAVFAVAVSGIGRLQLNSHYSAYFDSDDPLLIAHQQISEVYSRNDSVFVVLQSANSFLDSDTYRWLEDVTAQIADHSFVTSAVSVTALGIAGEVATADGDTVPSLQQLYDERNVIGLLLSENTKLAGIWVQIQLPLNNSRTVLETVAAVRHTIESATGNLAISAHYTGTIALNEAYIKVVQDDLLRIVPLLLLVMILVLGILLRSSRAVFTMLPVGICSVAGAFGIAGLFGTELAALNSYTPVIILSISVAGCVHMAMTYARNRNSGLAPQDAAISATRYNLLPMTLANGTTALGFLGLALSPSPPVRLVGYLVATGIVFSFVLCLTLLPVLQARFDPYRPGLADRVAFLDRLAIFATARRTGITILFLLLSLPAAWFASQNVVSDNVLEYFVPGNPFYEDTQLVADKLSGVNEVLYSVETGTEFGLFDADALNAPHSLANWLRLQNEVIRVVSVSDIDQLEEARQEGRLQERLDFYRNRIGASETDNPLLALEVSGDYSSAVVTTYLKQLGSSDLVDFDDRVHLWARENLGGFALRSGGPALMFAHLGEQNIRSMLAALVVATLVAALILGAALRSWRTALIGLACNILPILLVYSVWAVVYGNISIGAAIVMGMVLGIVLDDTIYLLTAYRRGVRRELANPVSSALRTVGPALIATSVALCAGLSLGLLSEFGPVWSMSVLSIAIIATALVVDLVLLPALLPASRSRREQV